MSGNSKRTHDSDTAPVAWAPFALIASLALLTTAARSEAPKFVNAVHLKLEGPITHETERKAFRHLERAKELGADLIIVEIDSPGGLYEQSRNIAHALRDYNGAKTVAYVGEKAISGGAMVALGCDEIVMKPLAALGDIGPIVLGEDGLFRHAPEKVVSLLARDLRDLAEKKNRPAAIAEAMADKQLDVFRYAKADGSETRFFSKREYDALPDRDKWKKTGGVPESGNGRFLTLNGKQAVAYQLASTTVDDFGGLTSRLGVAGNVMKIADSWVDATVRFLNHPVVTVVVVVAGLLFLYVELAVAGMGIAGLPAALCFLLFFWSHFLGGTAGWLEVTLFVGGLACLGMELFVIPGFGVVGISGIGLIVLSLVMACQGFVLPRTVTDWKTMSETLMQLGAGTVVFIGGAAFLWRYVGNLPMFQRLMLKPADFETVSLATSTGTTPLAADGLAMEAAAMIGAVGTANTDLRPAGKMRLGTQMFDVVADGFFVSAGRAVEVVSVSGNRIVVREVV
ncbi:MAG TPA: NfeD family protein [Planctomycetia bacterium]|nr:NfeD family protein [Planctomycetia bacterium]